LKTGENRPALVNRLNVTIIALLFIALTLFQYADKLGLGGTLAGSPPFGLTRVTLARILLCVPVLFTGFAFGLWKGVLVAMLALAIMLPRALLWSPSPPDAILESVGVLAVCLSVLWLLDIARRPNRQLETAQKDINKLRAELKTQVAVVSDQNRRLTDLTAFTAMLSQSLESRQVAERAVKTAGRMLPVDIVFIHVLDESKTELRLAASENLPMEHAAKLNNIKIGEGPIGMVADTGQRSLVADVSYDLRLRGVTVEGRRLQALAIVPMNAGGKISGVLSVATLQGRDFNHSELDLLSALGAQTGIALENSRLYSEQLAMAENLRLSAEGHRQIFENAYDAIWVHDLDGAMTVANDAAARIFGWKNKEEIVGKHVRSFIPPETRPLVVEMRRKLLTGEPVEQPYERVLLRKDGARVILKLTTNLITRGGQVIGFQHMARDVTLERRLQEDLRYYVQQVTKVQEDERQRIARELHDSTAQNLIAIIHQMENFCQDNVHLSAGDSTFLLNLRENLKEVLQEVRQYSRDLRPSILDDLGLLPAVEWLVEEIKRSNRLEAHLSVAGLERRFAPEVEVAFFRIVQEALRNIAKHAGANRVDVSFEFRERETVVVVKDDGKGFDMPSRMGELPRGGRLGLVGMQERARLVGASFTIDTAPGRGTTLRIELPVQPAGAS
jgi:PAS domain S-box-containing protein